MQKMRKKWKKKKEPKSFVRVVPAQSGGCLKRDILPSRFRRGIGVPQCRLKGQPCLCSYGRQRLKKLDSYSAPSAQVNMQFTNRRAPPSYLGSAHFLFIFFLDHTHVVHEMGQRGCLFFWKRTNRLCEASRSFQPVGESSRSIWLFFFSVSYSGFLDNFSGVSFFFPFSFFYFSFTFFFSKCIFFKFVNFSNPRSFSKFMFFFQN